MEPSSPKPLRYFWIAAGFVSLALGVLGALLPVLPGTPFFILSAYCFSRGSERLHQWLLRQPMVGPMIIDWRKNGVIRLRTKWMATALLLPSVFYLLLFREVPQGLKVVLVAVISLVFLFIWSRPSGSGPR